MRKNKRVLGIKDAPMDATQLANIHNGHIDYFNKLWERGKENELYLRGENLSSKQQQDYYNQDRIPFPNAITADKIHRIISSERTSRTSAKAEAIKPDSEIKSELVTLRFKKVERDSNLEYVESDIFTSGVGAMHGVGKVEVCYDRNGNKVIKVLDIDYQNVVWDSNAKDYEKQTGSFWAERKLVYRKDIAKDYGKEVADNISISEGEWGRPANQYWGTVDTNGNRDYDLIALFEHYQKVLRDLWYVVFNGKVVSKERSKKEAEEILRMLKIPYLASGQEIPKADVQKHTDDGFDKYIFTHNETLEYEETDLEFFPYSPYFAFCFKDQIWCMTDILKPKNKFMDKLISQIDYAFGVDLKNPAEIVEPWLHPGITIEEAQRRYKAGELVPVLRPNAINLPKSRGANPQWLAVYGMLKEDVTEYAGGALFSGAQKGLQRESQGAIQAKLRQQELIATLFVDNLRRWKRNTFKIVYSFLKKYDTEEQIIKTEGSNLSPEMIQLLQSYKIYQPSKTMPGAGYVTLNSPENKMSFYDDAEVEIVISDAELSETAREQRLAELALYNKLSPGSITPEIFLEYSDMSYSLKQKIKQNQAEMKKMQMEAFQNEERRKDEKLNIDKANVLVKDKGQVVPSKETEK